MGGSRLRRGTRGSFLRSLRRGGWIVDGEVEGMRCRRLENFARVICVLVICGLFVSLVEGLKGDG